MSNPMVKSNGATAETQPPEPKAAVSAAEMGARQREISVSEFFTKNRHLLGFDNPRKALLTCVKEAVRRASHRVVLPVGERREAVPALLIRPGLGNGSIPGVEEGNHGCGYRFSRYIADGSRQGS